MKIRHIPFGYTIENGEYVIARDEANAVIDIYEMYLGGKSFNEIACSMTIPYNEENSKWNKNTVKRILENKAYIGSSLYPRIINDYDFSRVQKLIEQKRPKKTILSESQTSLQEKTYCHRCGKPLKRVVGKVKFESWICSDCYYGYKITDEMLKSAVVAILNALIANPELADLNATKTYEPTDDIIRNDQCISQFLCEPRPDIDKIKEMILKNAENRYNQCTGNEYITNTEIIKNELAKHQPITEFNTDLFNKIIKTIQPDAEFRLYVQLINGKVIRQEIKRGE